MGTTGGRSNKGRVYEGGLRVPAILEWPARIPNPRKTNVPCNTSDIYPTLLEIVGLRFGIQPPLDGISLVPLIDGKMSSRPKAMGFWDYPIGGIRTPSKEWMSKLLEAQKVGKEVDDISRLRLNAGKITISYRYLPRSCSLARLAVETSSNRGKERYKVGIVQSHRRP